MERGSEGIDLIREAFEATWQAIRDETYRIEDLRWVAASQQADAVADRRYKEAADPGPAAFSANWPALDKARSPPSRRA